MLCSSDEASRYKSVLSVPQTGHNLPVIIELYPERLKHRVEMAG